MAVFAFILPGFVLARGTAAAPFWATNTVPVFAHNIRCVAENVWLSTCWASPGRTVSEMNGDALHGFHRIYDRTGRLVSVRLFEKDAFLANVEWTNERGWREGALTCPECLRGTKKEDLDAVWDVAKREM